MYTHIQMYPAMMLLLLWTNDVTTTNSTNKTDITVTICDCEKPKTRGILDLSDPSYCKGAKDYKPEKTIITPYDIATRKEPSITFDGWVCLQWKKTRCVSCWFGGSCTTEHLVEALTVSSEECWALKERRKCHDNEMQPDESGKGWIFDKDPIGEGRWIQTIDYIITNCAVSKLILHQEDETGPVSSVLGPVAKTFDEAVTTADLNKARIVWKWPQRRLEEKAGTYCEYKVLFSSKGSVQIQTEDHGRLVDKVKQLDFLFDPNLAPNVQAPRTLAIGYST